MTQSALTLHAPAKINLTLEVLRRLPSGFHEIRSVMQRISLADRLEFVAAPDLSLRCDLPELEGPENLAWRAAALLRERSGVRRGATITLHKRIPIAAGLGGGSSDAATTLAGLDALWQLGHPREYLMELGAELGSDVPFFLCASPCALAEGRGEALTALPELPRRWLVLVKPEAGISAGAVYKAFPPSAWSDGTRTQAWLERARREQTVPSPFNALEPVALQVEPSAAHARDALLEAGATAPLMSGSGSTYFALFEREAEAHTILQRLQTAGWQNAHLAYFA